MADPSRRIPLPGVEPTWYPPPPPKGARPVPKVPIPPPPFAREPHGNPAALLVGAGILAFVAAIAATCLASCLTPAQLAADGPAIEAGMAAACPAASLIPVAGPFIAAACQGEEAAVASAVKQANAELAAASPDAGAPADAKTLRPLYRTRHGRRRVVGYASACLCAAAQRHLDAIDASDAGSPVTVALPQAPAVVPVSPADAGAKGGR
ncbi:MAG TPA: hypothetical protein VLT47_10970 [Anaeromyxobacteraceae bacterium]|nr:hypothetical protein [Anaeromyxobacteraceae bacterium]